MMDIWGDIEALKDFTPVAIAERDVFEADIAADRGQRCGVDGRCDLFASGDAIN